MVKSHVKQIANQQKNKTVSQTETKVRDLEELRQLVLLIVASSMDQLVKIPQAPKLYHLAVQLEVHLPQQANHCAHELCHTYYYILISIVNISLFLRLY